MRKIRNTLILSGIAVMTLIIAGCLWSGTFVINQKIVFDPGDNFYSHRLDLTSSSTWKEHKDDIDQIEMVGFVLYFSNYEDDNVTFDAYVDAAAGAAPDPATVPATAKVVIDELTVPPGEDQIISYAKSLTVIKNLDALKKLVKSGSFDFYAESSGVDGSTFFVDSVTVVITFSAS